MPSGCMTLARPGPRSAASWLTCAGVGRHINPNRSGRRSSGASARSRTSGLWNERPQVRPRHQAAARKASAGLLPAHQGPGQPAGHAAAVSLSQGLAEDGLMAWRPQATVREAIGLDRKNRTPDIELALQDFLELPEQEQKELLFSALCNVTK